MEPLRVLRFILNMNPSNNLVPMVHGGAEVSRRSLGKRSGRFRTSSRSLKRLGSKPPRRSRWAKCSPRRFSGSATRSTAQRAGAAKTRLVNLIVTRVDDPALDRSVAGRFADNVVVDGLPFEVLEEVLDALDKAHRESKVRNSRGAWFYGAMRRRLRDHGIAERKKRQRPRAP